MQSNHMVIMNTQSTLNPSKDLNANRYVGDDYYTGVLVFQRGYVKGKGTFFVIPTPNAREEATEFNDTPQSVTHDSGLGHRRAGEARLVGWIGKDGSKAGTVPTRAVQVYVFK